MSSIENILNQMTRPEIPVLKHEDLLVREVIKAKDTSVLSAWWLSIPLYMIGCLWMKTYFVPGTNIISNLKELIDQNPNLSVLLFLVVPFIFAGLNMNSICKMYVFHRCLKPLVYSFIQWIQLITIIICLGIILIYFI